jgi:hypothetical protein
MPRPWANTQVFAVPRSMAMSVENMEAMLMVMPARTAQIVPGQTGEIRRNARIFPVARLQIATGLTLL